MDENDNNKIVFDESGGLKLKPRANLAQKTSVFEEKIEGYIVSLFGGRVTQDQAKYILVLLALAIFGVSIYLTITAFL